MTAEEREAALLITVRERRACLSELLTKSSDNWGYEDPVYRFHHQSFKVYSIQEQTRAIVAALAELAPEREPKNSHEERFRAEATRFMGEDRFNVKRPVARWHAAALIKLMWETWSDVFRNTLSHAERNLVSELRDARNKWAHQGPFPSAPSIPRS